MTLFNWSSFKASSFTWRVWSVFLWQIALILSTCDLLKPKYLIHHLQIACEWPQIELPCKDHGNLCYICPRWLCNCHTSFDLWMFGTRFDTFFLVVNVIDKGWVLNMWLYIVNLTCNKLIMKIVQSSFIHRFVHFTHKYHALKTCLTHG